MRKTAEKTVRLVTVLAMALVMTTQVFALEVPVSQTEQMVNGQQTLVKVFEVDPDTDPETLIEQGLEQNGYAYSMTSIVKDVVNEEDEKEITQEQAVTIDTSKEDDARVEALKTLPPFIEYEEDGYIGKLYPLVNTLELEEAGRTSHSGSNKVTRTYTTAYNDDSEIPASISVSGSTYTRSSISWADGEYLDGTTIPANYVATVTFSKPYSYTTVDGYSATMTYTGTVQKEINDVVRYTVTYLGTPLETAPAPSFIVAIIFGVLLLSLIVAILLLAQKRGMLPNYKLPKNRHNSTENKN